MPAVEQRRDVNYRADPVRIELRRVVYYCCNVETEGGQAGEGVGGVQLNWRQQHVHLVRVVLFQVEHACWAELVIVEDAHPFLLECREDEGIKRHVC